jgi:uncharacterized Zn-binding protein involved in type VI secretion
MPAAKENDQVVGVDIHIVLIGGPPVPTPLPHPFTGILDGSLSSDVKIMGSLAATVGSTATNTPSHVPQGGPFQSPPSNRATVQTGSSTVFINGQGAARLGDTATTCNDPSNLPVGTVIGTATVLIGG